MIKLKSVLWGDMNASFLSVELRVALFVRLLASKLFLLDGNSFNCIPHASCLGPYALSTWNPSVHMPQTHIYLFHNLFLFMPQPLCYRVIYNFFFPFYYFFKLLGSHFWFVMISLPQEPRSPIFTLLTIHLFLCDSPDSMYFQQLCDTFATEF